MFKKFINRMLCLIFGHQYVKVWESDWTCQDNYRQSYCRRCGRDFVDQVIENGNKNKGKYRRVK